MAPYLKPGWFTKKVNALAARVGAANTLAVRGRSSGLERTVAVNVVDHDGARYLVSPRGDTEWARNLRAARVGELRRRGRIESFVAVEIPADQRPPIIAAYRRRWDKQAGKLFDALPDPADHPVFRIDPV